MKVKTVFLAVLMAVPAAAAVPNTITYQGRLVKSGVTTGGSHTFHACLKAGGGNLWCKDFTLSLPASGDFTLLLDPPASIDWIANAIQLELTVDGRVLSPADDFTAVPYALTAATASVAQSLSGQLQSSKVLLAGASASLDTWQSAAAPGMIDAGKVQGPFTSNISVKNGLDMNNTKITNLADATNPGDAVNLGQVVAAVLPPGTILPFAGTAVPAGFRLCDGATVSRTTFKPLFDAIGTAWGAGDGSSTFNLPDLRRRALVGSGGTGSAVLGSAVGSTGGEETHTLTITEMPSHTHNVNDPGHSHSQAFGLSGANGSGNVARQGQNDNSASTQSSQTGITVGNAGGGAAHNVMQPSAVVNYIIKT
jgi:microcystin-dependent protein